MDVSAPTDGQGSEEDCAYAKLISHGYSGEGMRSVGEKVWDSMNYLRGLVLAAVHVTNKTDPKLLKRTKIIASCKFIGPCDIFDNTASCDSTDAFPSDYLLRNR